MLRREQAEISSRATAGDRDLEEAIADRRESVDPEFAELAMVGIPSRGRVNRPQTSVPGLYLIEVGTIGEIKADLQALPKRRKDILKLEGMDDHVQYKFGYSKSLDNRMGQHVGCEFKNTRVVNTWSWPTNLSMLVEGEDHIRSKFKELGAHILSNTIDWPVLPPKYEDVIVDIIEESVRKYLVNNDPHVKVIT